MHPFVIQTLRNVDSVLDSRGAVAEWGFHFPGKSIGNICHRAVHSNLNKVFCVEGHSLGDIVCIADCNFLFGNGNHSGCSGLILRDFSFILHLNPDIVYGVDCDGVVIAMISLDGKIVHICVNII